jgi:superfamily I DNA and RNA helicase
MLEALDRRPELKFDAIVVDEGQDFPEQWWDVLELSQSDANHPVFYVFYDDNQQIYRESTVLPDGLAPIPLTVNLRNSRPIHRLAARRYDGSDFTCVGPEGREAEMVVVSDTRSMKNEISRALHRLTQEEGVKPAEIAVLTGKSLGDSDASEAGRIGVFEVEQSDIEQDEKITFDTVRRFKGLERSTIVLCEMEKASRDLVYVALTRARSHLITIGSKEFIETLA